MYRVVLLFFSVKYTVKMISVKKVILLLFLTWRYQAGMGLNSFIFFTNIYRKKLIIKLFCYYSIKFLNQIIVLNISVKLELLVYLPRIQNLKLNIMNIYLKIAKFILQKNRKSFFLKSTLEILSA